MDLTGNSRGLEDEVKNCKGLIGKMVNDILIMEPTVSGFHILQRYEGLLVSKGT